MLKGSGHPNPGSVVHPKLDHILQLCGSLAVRVEDVCLVDGFIRVATTEQSGVCDVLQRVRAVADQQEGFNNGRGNRS